MAQEQVQQRSYAPEIAGAGAGMALPTLAAIEHHKKLVALKRLVEKAKEMSLEELREKSRAGDVVLESQPSKILNGGLHGRATIAAGSPLTHAELLGPDLMTHSGGHQIGGVGGTVHERGLHRLFRNIERHTPLAPLPKGEQKRLEKLLKSIDKVHAGKLESSPYAGGTTYHEYFSELERDKKPFVLLRRASGKPLSRSEEAALRGWLNKSDAAYYDVRKLFKNLGRGLLAPSGALGSRIKGFGPACKGQICTSQAGQALKGLGGLQSGRSTYGLPIELAVDPLAKLVGVHDKKTLLDHLRTSRLQNAGVRAGVIGLLGLGGAAAVHGGRKLHEQAQSWSGRREGKTQKTAMPWVNTGLSRTPKYFDFLAHHQAPLSQLAAHIPRHGLGLNSQAGPAAMTPEGYAALSYGMRFLDPVVARLSAGQSSALQRLLSVLGKRKPLEQSPGHHPRQALELYPESGIKRVYNIDSRDHVSIMGTPAMTPERLKQIEEAARALLPEMPEVARTSAQKLNLLYQNAPQTLPRITAPAVAPAAKPRGFKPLIRG